MSFGLSPAIGMWAGCMMGLNLSRCPPLEPLRLVSGRCWFGRFAPRYPRFASRSRLVSLPLPESSNNRGSLPLKNKYQKIELPLEHFAQVAWHFKPTIFQMGQFLSALTTDCGPP